MAIFNEFKEMFNKAAQSVSSKTKEGVEITRLLSEGRSLSNEISVLYNEIGRTYVESKGKDLEALASLCARVEELKERQAEVERQKIQLRNQNRCPACGAAMAKGARFCSSCGRRMPEPDAQPEPAPAAENVSYCPECGAMREDDAPFCAVCGYNYNAPAPEEKPVIITRPIITKSNDDSDEAPTDFEAD